MSIYQVLISNPAKKIYLVLGLLIYRSRDIINYFQELYYAIEEIKTPLQFVQFVSVQICISLILFKIPEVIVRQLLQFYKTWWANHKSDIWRMIATVMVVMTTHIVLEFDWKILIK